MNAVRASSSKVVCCHFSSDGKLLASGGHDKKVSLEVSKILPWQCLIVIDLLYLMPWFLKNNLYFFCPSSLAGCFMVYWYLKTKNNTWRALITHYWCSFQSKHGKTCNIFFWQNCQGLGCGQCKPTESSVWCFFSPY